MLLGEGSGEATRRRCRRHRLVGADEKVVLACGEGRSRVSGKRPCVGPRRGESVSPSALPLFACSRTHPRSAPPPPPRRIATARVSYLASTPSSKPLQMAFIPGVPTYRTAAAAYEQREVQAKGVRAGTARSCLWVGRDASLRRPDAMLSGPRVAPALLDPLADRDREGVRLWRKVLGAMVPLISVRTARRHPGYASDGGVKTRR